MRSRGFRVIEMSLPEDVKKLLEEIKKRGLKVDIIAVEKTPPPNETYDVFKDSEYVGVKSADDVFKEDNIAVCGKSVCTVFEGDLMKLILDRLKGEVIEVEEEEE